MRFAREDTGIYLSISRGCRRRRRRRGFVRVKKWGGVCGGAEQGVVGLAICSRASLLLGECLKYPDVLFL